MRHGILSERDIYLLWGGVMEKEYIPREAVLAVKKPFPTSKDSVTLYQLYFISPSAVEKIPAADVVSRDCYDRILVENDDMRAIIDTYGGLKNIQSAFVKLHEIETADVVPVVKANWEWNPDGMDWGIGAWQFSACKAMSPMWWNTDKTNPHTKSGHRYCPNCGARMDLVTDCNQVKDGDGE